MNAIQVSGWSVEVPAASVAARKAVLDSLAGVDPAGPIPDGEIGQMIADGIAAELLAADAWMGQVEKCSLAFREPYRLMAEKIKRTSDEFMTVVVQRWQVLGRKLGEFEANKQAAAIAINRQRQEEANQAHQAKVDRVNEMAKTECAEVVQAAREQLQLEAPTAVAKFAPPETAGVRAKPSYDYTVTDARKVAEWCWANDKMWVHEITFFRRDIIGYLNREGEVDRNIPGLAVGFGVDVKPKRQRAKKANEIMAEATRVEL